MVALLEGDTRPAEHYDVALRAHVQAVFDSLGALQPVASDEEPAMDRKNLSTSLTLTKSKGAALASRHASMQSVAVAASDASGAEERFFSDFAAALDAADDLMVLENLTWASLFHLRYLASVRLSREADVARLRAVVEYALGHPTAAPLAAPVRKRASRLLQFLVAHSMDPDGALLGLQPAQAFAARCASVPPELRDKIVGWTAEEQPQPLAGSQLSHGMLLVAGDRTGALRFVRFSRVDPTKTHCLQVWRSALQREGELIDCTCGVYALTAEQRAKLGGDVAAMSSLLHNPLAPLQTEVGALLASKVDAFLAQHGADMFLLGLTEADLVGDDLDLSRYGIAKDSGQEMCTKLLSLFDEQKKRLVALRAHFKPAEMEETAAQVAALVNQHLSHLDPAQVFAPVRHVEIEAARALALRSVAAFQQALELRGGHVDELIDFVIVNWKKLSDPSARKTLKKGGSTMRTRSVSRGSLKSFLASGKKELSSSGSIPSSPTVQRAAAGGAAEGPAGTEATTPKRKQTTTLRGLFGKKTE